MKNKRLKTTLCALLLTAVCGIGAGASSASQRVISSRTLNWYAHRVEGQPPSVMPEAKEFFYGYNAVFAGDGERKVIYLTFDSGYENGCTDAILQILQDKSVPAAFFLDGNYVRRNPELVVKMAHNGHLVCNHSLKHPDMTKLTDIGLYSMQLSEWENLVRALGVEPAKLFRPPMGKFSELTLKYDMQLGYKTVFWSVAHADWDTNKQPEPDAALKLLTQRTHPGAIVLLHSVSQTNAKILATYIDAMRADGYEFLPLTELP